MQSTLFNDPVQRHFLGWDKPIIHAAASWLHRYVADDVLMLENVTIVLPTLRGVRQLEDRLDLLADAGGPVRRGGWFGTVGSMPEQLYDLGEVCGKKFRRLTDLQQTLHWSEVLRTTDSEMLRRLIGRVPESNDIAGWMAIASTVDRLAIDLAAAGVSFAEVAESLPSEAERERWRVLGELIERFRDQLSRTSSIDVHSARRRAIESNSCRCRGEVVLVGCTDLSPTMTDMLAQLTSPVHSLVAAPPGAEARFDSFGNVSRTAWAAANISINDDDLIAAGDVAEQADAAAAVMRDLSVEDEWSAGDVVIGATDESQVPAIEFSMMGRDTPTFRNQGYTVAETAVGRLIDLAAAVVRHRSWESLAALIRHPDASRMLVDSSDRSLTRLDEFRNEAFAVSIDDPLPDPMTKKYADVVELTRAIDEWLAPLGTTKQTLAARSRAIADWVTSIFSYQDDNHGLHPRTAAAAESLVDWLREHAELDPDIDPILSPIAMMEIVLDACGSLRIADQQAEDQTSILGWLDLVFDDAPAMIVVGLNEPFVPEAITSDAFLPGSLRSRLKIADNERRYARDAHTLQCIVASRRRIKLIVGRWSADGSPTPPSRLLAAETADRVASRIRRLFGTSAAVDPTPHRWDDQGEVLLGEPSRRRPNLKRLPPANVRRMSVTSFKNYLTCPYRFYLRHVLHLKPIDDAAGELAANQFGDLVHNSLEIWGRGSGKDETRPDQIEAAMHDALAKYAADNYGRSATAAVQLQIHQARQKLSHVARVQAVRIAEGWVVDKVEAAVNEDVAAIEIDGYRMGLRGRFDRIDHHPDTGRYAILDYKTHGYKPEKKHLDKDGQWIDLQLPLYRRMIPFLDIDADPAEIEVGYFNIADKPTETRINIAEFSSSQWSAADALIDDIVRRIVAEDFAPAEEPPRYDDYEMIVDAGWCDMEPIA